MKHQPYPVEIRIKQFMKSKMIEFPDLKEKYGPRVQVIERGYLWDDIVGFFSRRERVS